MTTYNRSEQATNLLKLLGKKNNFQDVKFTPYLQNQFATYANNYIKDYIVINDSTNSSSFVASQLKNYQYKFDATKVDAISNIYLKINIHESTDTNKLNQPLFVTRLFDNVKYYFNPNIEYNAKEMFNLQLSSSSKIDDYDETISSWGSNNALSIATEKVLYTPLVIPKLPSSILNENELYLPISTLTNDTINFDIQFNALATIFDVSSAAFTKFTVQIVFEVVKFENPNFIPKFSIFNNSFKMPNFVTAATTDSFNLNQFCNFSSLSSIHVISVLTSEYGTTSNLKYITPTAYELVHNGSVISKSDTADEFVNKLKVFLSSAYYKNKCAITYDNVIPIIPLKAKISKFNSSTVLSKCASFHTGDTLQLNITWPNNTSKTTEIYAIYNSMIDSKNKNKIVDINIA